MMMHGTHMHRRKEKRAAGGTSADVDCGRVLGEHSGLFAVRDLNFAQLHFQLVLLRMVYMRRISLLVRVALPYTTLYHSNF